MFEMELKFSKLVKSIAFSEPTIRLAAQSTTYALRIQQRKQAFAKEKEEKYLCKKTLNL